MGLGVATGSAGAGPAGARMAGVKVVGGAAAAGAWAGKVAALTRAAYAGSDPLPGLPPPDGAGDSPGMVERELRSGTAAWLALDPDGAAIGVMRVAATDHGTW